MNFSSDSTESESGNSLANALQGGEETEFVTSVPAKQVSHGAIVMGLVLLACGAGTYFMYMRSGPRSAASEPEAAAAANTINQFLSSGSDNVREMKDLLASTERVVQKFLAYPGRAQIPVDKLQTNPFQLLLPKPPEQAAKQEDEDAAKRLEKARKVMLAEAQKLQLQSIIHGRRKGALINNSLYTEGQEVDGFKVDAINPRSVIVSHDEMKFELTMQD